jgi:hypothetical protein
MINDLFQNESTPTSIATTEFARIRRDAIWWSNLHQNQGPVYVYRGASGRYFLSRTTITGTGAPTLVTTVLPNTVYQSGERQEWREWQMQLGDRRF